MRYLSASVLLSAVLKLHFNIFILKACLSKLIIIPGPRRAEETEEGAEGNGEVTN